MPVNPLFSFFYEILYRYLQHSEVFFSDFEKHLAFL